jgi:hypothetical protein
VIGFSVTRVLPNGKRSSLHFARGAEQRAPKAFLRCGYVNQTARVQTDRDQRSSSAGIDEEIDDSSFGERKAGPADALRDATQSVQKPLVNNRSLGPARLRSSR